MLALSVVHCFRKKLVDVWLSSEYASYPRGYEDVLKIVPAFDSFNATYSDFIPVMVLKNCRPDFFITCLRKSCFLSVIPASKIAEKTFVTPVFRTELSLTEFLVRFLAVLIHFSSFFRFFLFWDGKSLQERAFNIGFPQGSILICIFSLLCINNLSHDVISYTLYADNATFYLKYDLHYDLLQQLELGCCRFWAGAPNSFLDTMDTLQKRVFRPVSLTLLVKMWQL